METTELACPHCHAPVKTGDVFCGHCGKSLAVSSSAQGDVFTVLRPTLLYYFFTLLLLATYKFTALFPVGYEGLKVVTVIDVTIVIIFWIHNRQEINSLFSLAPVTLKITAGTILGAVVASLVVSVVAEIVNWSIHDDTFYDTYMFNDTAYPLLYSTVFIAIQPAIFEEVAFRGFLFNNLKVVTSGVSAVYITGFVFGVMHLQFIGLLWLVPLGLMLGFLRNKYNTLWYGIVAHFTYNLCITLYEFWGWF